MIVVFDAHCLLCSGWVRRYRLFGRSDACMLPPEGSVHRFLD